MFHLKVLGGPGQGRTIILTYVDGKCGRKQSESREEKVFADLSRNCQQAEGYGVSVVAGVVKKMLGSTANRNQRS